MVKEQKIFDYRDRLDRTLASHDLVNKDSIRNLVRNQLIQSSPSDRHGEIDSFLEKRTTEVSGFLDTLRSASKNDGKLSEIDGVAQRDWKLKHDSEDFRVMYREGPEGTPFHTLLVEGYVDGPLDVCLCLSWEAALFKKWWPQFSIPPFKVTTAECLQNVRMGEQVVQLRVKVPWPVSAREIILHYFQVEYYEDGLVVVLLNSISNTDGIDRSTHGFTQEGIPDVKDLVRVDIVGGYALQKVASNISYFRTIATMDMKLDFVPPSLINFLSRQLVGSGFKLYKKTVASVVAKGDEDFSKALQGPLYVRVREGLAPNHNLKKALKHEVLENDKTPSLGGYASEVPQVDTMVLEQIILSDSHATKSSNTDTLVAGQKYNGEIEEIVLEKETKLVEGQTSHGKIDAEEEQPPKSNEDKLIDYSTIEWSGDQDDKEKHLISPEVEHALSILDHAISLVRRGFSIQSWSGSKRNHQEVPDLQRSAAEMGSVSSEDVLDDRATLKVPKIENMEAVSDGESSSGFFDIRHDKQDSPPREVNHKQKSPASQQDVTALNRIRHDVGFSPNSENTLEAPVLDHGSKGFKEVTVKANAIHASNDTGGELRRKKQRGCCLYFFYSNK